MADGEDEIVEVVVWRKYLVAAKEVHKRVWFWLAAAVVLLSVLLVVMWCHHDRCRVEAPYPVVVIKHVPVIVEKPVYVYVHDAPPAPPPAKPVAHVAHRATHRVVHHCRCSCRH